MDIGRFHLPQELVDNILRQLAEDVHDVQSARLVCKSFCYGATPLITDVWSSPSELFTVPSSSSLDTAIQEPFYPTAATRPAGLSLPRPLTVWTWVNMPMEVPLEHPETEIGARFRELMFKPHRVDHGARQNGARKATCWGRVREAPAIFWIILQWDRKSSWYAYRRSEYAKDLRTFLDAVVPGCLSESRSEKFALAHYARHNRPLFFGYNDVRTIYFKLSMTAKQREKFEQTRHLMRGQMSTRSQNSLGPSQWTWLSGLRNFKGSSAIAARFVFHWKNEQLEMDYRANMRDSSDPRAQRVVDRFQAELEALGVLGEESLHCYFKTGPWNN